jgi:transposase
MTDHTPIPKISRLEVISTGARRRWTPSEKQRIVAESYGGRRLVSATARRNGLSASQLFTWRRLAREGRLVEADDGATFARAVISCETSTSSLPSYPDGAEAAENLASSSCSVSAPGRMELVLTGGCRVIVDNSVDVATLGRVIDVLERRR